MKKTYYVLWLILAILSINLDLAAQEQPVDLTVISSIDFNGSVRRHGIGLMECLKDTLSINFVPSRAIDLNEVDPEVQQIILSGMNTPGHVAILEDPLWFANAVPNSQIKIAFSVYEATRIPQEWVETLNKNFDAVVVADPFYLKVYKKSGVNIPIFHIPLGVYIDDFLQKPLKQAANKPFVFGCCARFFKRKNHHMLIKAFIQEFGNRKDVVLKINGGGKWGSNKIYTHLKKIVAKNKVSNVYVTHDALPWSDYIEFMSGIDCYINISQGEGFSISPREALALGIPAIVSNNTAQKTICDSTFVRPVPSNIRIPKRIGKNDQPAYRFNCRLEDVREALKDVYHSYDHYLAKAHEGRSWAAQYRWLNLKKKYLNLIKPNNVILGDRNEITDEYLMTTSKQLYEKYRNLQLTNNVL